MKKHRILQVPPVRFGLVLGLINGLVGLLVAPVMLFAGGVIAAAVGKETGFGESFRLFGESAQHFEESCAQRMPKD